MNKPVTFSAPDLEFDTPAAARRRRYRRLKDKLTSGSVAVGGLSVIAAIMLIFIYLFYEVMPLFKAAEIEPWQTGASATAAPYARPGSDAPTHYLAIEEQNEVAFRLDAKGQASFFEAPTGELISQQSVGLSDTPVTGFALNSDHSQLFALAHADGSLTVAKHHYKITYPDGERLITPQIQYPYGEEPLELSPALEEITRLAFRDGEQRASAAAFDGESLQLTRFAKEENFITEALEITAEHYPLPKPAHPITRILIGPDQSWLYLVGNQGQLTPMDIRDPDAPQLHPTLQAAGREIVSVAFLLGGNSLLIGDRQGQISQWFLVRDDNNQYSLQKVRTFTAEADLPASLIVPEQRRKGFVVAQQGAVSLYNATAHNRVLTVHLDEDAIAQMAISPRADALLVEDENGRMSYWHVDNEHPEVSWSALWNRVWYEGYQEPEYVWQSSASNNDFEPKYSLAPLAFGTLKAAFYAMLLATPLAIAGAVYTAYFMAPSLRRKIKPFIELMEALPTVILGFLAGLWLAPFVEDHLAGIFTLLLVVPLGILVFGFGWHRAPRKLRWLVPEGWDSALLIPVIAVLVWLAMPLSEGIEGLFFDGNLRTYITNELGIGFDQRNALVVGLAMGFAVIPTIFSITEDAIFSVPKHLSNGSLALGATPWQTLSRVVLPTASPGIFSAVMIGMGRAVGETMIVLMATGNTPIMDANIFEGMRTLAANIAVEVPESEVGSSHYRILFLAALVLFLFTFVVNTVAELVRQRLRGKYGSL